MGTTIARTEFGVEVMRTFDGGRWLWNQDQSWLEHIEAGKVMPWVTVTLNERQNTFFEAIMQSCKSEEQRVYGLMKLQEES